MNYQFNTILNGNNQNVPSDTKEGGEITPERVYKNFQEWNELGKQDSRESETTHQPSQSHQDNKD